MDLRLGENLSGIKKDYVAPFFWLHNEGRDSLLEELDAVQRSGISSVCFESRVHSGFCGETWWSDMRFLLDECKKRGMHAWILDERKCPSGSANGAFEKYPDLRPYEITERHVDIPGPVNGGSLMCSCRKENPDDEILAVTAYRHIENSMLYEDESADLTNGISGDMLYFSLGEGIWRIFFLIKTRKNVLPFCDKLRAESTDLVIREIYEKHFKNLGDYFGTTLRGFFCDEPGFHNNAANSYTTPMGVDSAQYPWGNCVLNHFKHKYGNRAFERLTLLWFETGSNLSKKVRTEYMDFITKEYEKNYTDKIAQWGRKHGVQFIGHVLEDNNRHTETGFGCGHFFGAIGSMDMSGIDVVLHQIVLGLHNCISVSDASYKNVNNLFFQYYLAKMGVSFAHADKRKNGRAMCEIFGAYGYAEGTKTMKYLADHMLVRGVSYFVPHAFSPKRNDSDSPPHFYNNGENPQFKYFRHIIDYIQRMAHLIDGSVHVSSCVIVYNAFAMHAGGKYLPLEKIAKELYDKNIDYDILPDYIIETIDENGCINGEEHRLVILPYSEFVPQSVTDALKRTNAEVIIAAENDKEEGAFNTVKMSELADFIEKKGLRDISADYGEGILRAYHCKRNGADIYIFSNEDINNAVNAEVSFRDFGGGNYCSYDAMENKAFKCCSDNGKVKLNIPPYNTRVVITGDIDRESIDRNSFEKYDDSACIYEDVIEDNFRISLFGDDNKEFVISSCGKLFDITGRGHYPDYSGFIIYDFNFTDKDDGEKILDLGYVGETAEVEINGKPVGTKISPPYRFNITEFTKPGQNAARVTVSNNLAYRLKDYYSRYLLMDKSGIIGPVSIKYYKGE